MKQPVSIIIPAFNEEDRIEDTIPKVLCFLGGNEYPGEVIVVDDGSTDSTAAVAEESLVAADDLSTRVIRYEENRGKGFAVRTGLAAAKEDIALFTDADLSTPITEFPKLVEPIMKGVLDLTIGSRALDRRLIGNHQPWRREQGGKLFNLLVRAFTGLPFWDTQCGFKAFNMSRFRPLLPKLVIDRFGFDVEFLFAARESGLRIKEIPVRWDHCEGTKVSMARDSLRMLLEIYEIRRKSRSGQYILPGSQAVPNGSDPAMADKDRRSNEYKA